MPSNELYSRREIVSSSPIQHARDAYLDGDLERCLRALESSKSPLLADQREATLLRARALLRLHRESEVVAALGPLLGTFCGADEITTAAMLHGVAIFRSVSVERGLSALLSTASAAESSEAHPTIRAELSYWIGVAYWARGDHAATLAYAHKAETAGADVISVRATTLRAFVAAAKERYGDALAVFRAARLAYDRCRERDRNLLERIVVQIAGLELMLRSARVTGSHTLPANEARLPDSHSNSVPGVLRMQISAFDAWLYAFDGNQARAYRSVRVAEDLAPNTAWRVWALANRAGVALAFADVAMATEFSAQALEIVDTVDWEATVHEERVGLLVLSDVLATTQPLSAVTTFGKYNAIMTELSRSVAFHDDIRLRILEAFVAGLVHRIRGELSEAWAAFKKAYVESYRIGYLWRAAASLIELDATPVVARPRGDFYLEAAAELVREHFPQSFLARRLGRWTLTHHDANVARLPRVPREVLRHLLEGRNAKEIAAVMGLAPGTAKNYVNGILREFGVRSTQQLLVTCYRRGLGTPSWHTEKSRGTSGPRVVSADSSPRP